MKSLQIGCAPQEGGHDNKVLARQCEQLLTSSSPPRLPGTDSSRHRKPPTTVRLALSASSLASHGPDSTPGRELWSEGRERGARRRRGRGEADATAGTGGGPSSPSSHSLHPAGRR